MKYFVRAAGLTVALAISTLAQFHLPGSGGKSDPTPKTASPASPAPPGFDYYVLALSWTPRKGDPFVVRGLLPERIEGAAPESCGTVKKVSGSAMSLVLPFMASQSAIQQEWAKHGSCTGLSAADYFNGVRYTRSEVQIPVQMTSLEELTTQSPLQIETQFAGANPGFPAGAFRVACEGGVFTEVRVCFDRQFKPHECVPSAAECAAAELSIQPPLL